MKRILITGITGFVGSNLVEYFAGSEEVQIFGYSRDASLAKKDYPDIEFLPEIKASILDRYLIDTIIHLAGIAHDLSGNFTAEDYDRVNYKWTCELYDKFLRSSVKKFVFVSSIKAVVDQEDEIIDEFYKPHPVSDYGISKLKAEEYISLHQQSNKTSYILRPCMIHGPGNKGNLNLLYKFVKKGIPYPLSAYENKRSYLSIENFCFAVQEILQDQLPGGDYLLSDNDSISTMDLVKLISEVSNHHLSLIKIPKAIVHGLAKIGSLINAPFNSETLVKLVGNMEVSNKKLLLHLGKELPVSTVEGLKRTIRSFNE